MKSPLSILFLFLIGAPVFAQTGNHELGFNASPLLHQFLRASSVPEDSDHQLLIEYGPYMVNYRNFGSRGNFRMGAGILIYNNIEDRPVFLEEMKRVHLDFRAGAEKMYSIAKKWRGYFGLDAVYSHKKIYINGLADNTLPEKTRTAIGIGPVIGVQYYFLERFSLFTESSFYFFRVHKKTNNLETINGEPDFIESESLGFQSIFNLPLSLFLSFNF